MLVILGHHVLDLGLGVPAKSGEGQDLGDFHVSFRGGREALGGDVVSQEPREGFGELHVVLF